VVDRDVNGRTDITDIVFVYIFLFEYELDTDSVILPDKIVMDIDIVKI